jgi:hypothetical protein
MVGWEPSYRQMPQACLSTWPSRLPPEDHGWHGGQPVTIEMLPSYCLKLRPAMSPSMISVAGCAHHTGEDTSPWRNCAPLYLGRPGDRQSHRRPRPGRRNPPEDPRAVSIRPERFQTRRARARTRRVHGDPRIPLRPRGMPSSQSTGQPEGPRHGRRTRGCFCGLAAGIWHGSALDLSTSPPAQWGQLLPASQQPAEIRLPVGSTAPYRIRGPRDRP